MSALICHNTFIFTKMLGLLQLNHNQSSDRLKTLLSLQATEWQVLNTV